MIESDISSVLVTANKDIEFLIAFVRTLEMMVRLKSNNFVQRST